jgi:hypothetical protein
VALLPDALLLDLSLKYVFESLRLVDAQPLRRKLEQFRTRAPLD